jgi:hypothetical protein
LSSLTTNASKRDSGMSDFLPTGSLCQRLIYELSECKPRIAAERPHLQ